jgi:hypothetical protein
MLGNDTGNPKQSGSTYSAFAFPKSLQKYSFPYKTCRKLLSALRRSWWVD